MAQQRLAHAPQFAGAVAGGARDRGGPGAGTRSTAGLAGRGGADGDVLLGPEDGLGERDFQHALDVLSLRRAGPPGGAPGTERATTKEGVKDVSQPAPSETAEGVGHALAIRPEHVVLAPPLRVLQGFVGPVDKLEALLVGLRLSGRPGVAIGVQLAREPQVSTLYFFVCSVAANAEEGIIVFLSHGLSSFAHGRFRWFPSCLVRRLRHRP